MAGTTKKTTTKKKAPAKPAKKEPGVIATIVSLLERASEDKPLSKDAAVKALAKRFPEREEEGMGRTFTIQTGRLKKEKGLDVRKNENGFWINE